MTSSSVVLEPTLNYLIGLKSYANPAFLKHFKKADAALTSNQASKHLGRGMDFAEFRHYQPGDDVRLIDWRATARSGKTQVRVYREERERPVYFVVDQSLGMRFGTQRTFKSTLACEIAAWLAWSAFKNQDRIGGQIVGAEDTPVGLPHPGKKGVLRFLQLLSQKTLSVKEVEWLTVLRHLRKRLKSQSLICCLSDFEGFSDMAQQEAKALVLSHEVVFCHLSDPLERQAPPPGLYTVTDSYRQCWFDTRDPAFCQQYAAQFEQSFQQLKTFCAQSGMGFFSFLTSELPWKSYRPIKLPRY